VTSPQFTMTIPNPQEKYTFWVLAIDTAGNQSASSNAITFGTIVPCVPGLPCNNSTRPPSSSPTSPPAPICAVKWDTSQWSTGFVTTVKFTNLLSYTAQDWILTWTFPGGQKVTNSWSSVVTQNGADVLVHGAPWNSEIQPGKSVTFGFAGTYRVSNARPTAVLFHGQPCTLS
jgi:endo-1,4-beta-xylanase